jgi:triosephosphate isomerase
MPNRKRSMSNRSKKIIAGNHKMFTTLPGGIALAKEIHRSCGQLAESVDVVLFPPATHLFAVSGILNHTPISTGIQNCSSYREGAYTGEISAEMAKSAGADYVLIGHSERRHIFGETDEMLIQKMKQARQAGLKIIYCFGETLAQRDNGHVEEIIRSQLSVLSQLDEFSENDIELAYEPVWAIGTGLTASPIEAQKVHALVRTCLSGHPRVAREIRILYGGSVKPENAVELLEKPDIDGLLVGGASLKADSFSAIVQSAIP